MAREPCRLPLLLLLGLVLAACGGSSSTFLDPDQDPPGPTTRDRAISTDTPGNELSAFPQVCCSGNRIYVVWYDRRNGSVDIYFNRSLDFGQTWLDQDVRLDTDLPAGRSNSWLPQLCCEGLAVQVVWRDERNGFADIYLNRSLDGGLTWLATDVRVSRGGFATSTSRDPRICCFGSTLFVTWRDDRDGAWDVYFNRSLDGGLTWEDADTRLNTDDAGANNAVDPAIACAGNAVVVTWRDDRDGGSDLYASRSADGGATWSSADVRLSDAMTGGGSASAPRLAAAGSSFHLVWQDGRDGAGDIRYVRSLDGGSTWSASDRRLDTDAAGSGASSAPDLCVAGSDVFVTWQDERDGLADIRFNASRDGGASWRVDDVRVETEPAGLTRSFVPRIRCDGSRVGITWYDDREGAMDVYLRWSGDGGSTWTIEDLRMDDDELGAEHSLFPTLCCEGDRVFVVWTDQRHGDGDVYGRGADFGAVP